MNLMFLLLLGFVLMLEGQDLNRLLDSKAVAPRRNLGSQTVGDNVAKSETCVFGYPELICTNIACNSNLESDVFGDPVECATSEYFLMYSTTASFCLYPGRIPEKCKEGECFYEKECKKNTYRSGSDYMGSGSNSGSWGPSGSDTVSGSGMSSGSDYMAGSGSDHTSGSDYMGSEVIPTLRPTLRPTQPTLRPTQPTPRPTQPTLRPTQPTPRPTVPTPRPTETVGDCTIKKASTWDGKIQATYTDCTKYNIPAAATFIVKIPEITGTTHCPLIKDWVFSAGCPNGVCSIEKKFEISMDVCDLLIAIATGGLAKAAKSASKALVKQLGKQMTKQWQKDMARKQADNIGNGVERRARQSNVGTCANIGSDIKDLLKCLFININIDIPGLKEFLEIFSQSITLSVNAGMDFHIASQQIRNVDISIDLKANFDGLDPGAITLMAKSGEIPSKNCDSPKNMAKKMTASMGLTRSGFSGSFMITCGRVDFSVEKIGELLKNGAEIIGKAIANAPQNIKNTLRNAKNKLTDVCGTIKKSKNVCENITTKVCGEVVGRRRRRRRDERRRRKAPRRRRKWFPWGRRSLDEEANELVNEKDGPDGRRNLFGDVVDAGAEVVGPVVDVVKEGVDWVCNNVVNKVCKIEWLPVC